MPGEAAPGSPRTGLSAAGREVARLTWTRAIGVDPAEVLPGEVLIAAREGLDAVIALEWDGAVVAAAPPRVAGELAGIRPEMLLDADADALARVMPGARPLGSADLLFADRAPSGTGTARNAAADDLAAMRSAVTPDEWDEAGLESMPHRWAVDDAQGDVAAIAGYEVWRDRVAQLGVLTGPSARGRGHGVSVAAAATRAAIGHGLVAQWRSRRGNDASLASARRLGFVLVGRQVAVALD